MDDPYKILGVSRNASDDEIKRAYRELVKKYHPDKYAGNPLADLVEEKMKEINEAYETIERERRSGAQPDYNAFDQGYTEGGGGTAYQYANQSSTGASAMYNEIRLMINAGRYAEAKLRLDSVEESGRGAEWNFLYGCILLRRGAVFDAQKYIDRACYLDPVNAEYRAARERIRQSAAGYGGYRQASPTGACDICSGLICADCCCEAMGGDLIRCC
jgi:molecular chaperone DnaJ